MKIGIFGGSFNPPHKMHEKIALNLIEQNYIDKVIYVPTGNKYEKKDLIDAKYRYDMLKLITQNNPNLEVSDYEIKNVLTYTYQTLDYFKNKYLNDEIYFICGSDNLMEIETWKHYEYILEKYKLLIIKRNNDDINEILNRINSKNIIITDIEPYNMSSTNIRKILKQNRLETLYTQIDKKVLEYIKNEKIYQ